MKTFSINSVLCYNFDTVVTTYSLKELALETRKLFEVWRDWANGQKFIATLGDGSPIEAVSRPYHDVCEVRSKRGIENRHATEIVICYDEREFASAFEDQEFESTSDEI